MEDDCFYILSNKFQEKLGIFLIMFSDEKPNQYKFLLKWKNKLDIDNAGIGIIRQENKFKELVISYKTIYMNTYNV